MISSTLSTAAGKPKPLIVVSVSSPYDFAMDKMIGTYVCTFDFTETAMAALVRVLSGECQAQGTLPGTLRKSRKVQKSRQHWLVENWHRERDSRGLTALIHAVSKASTPTSPPKDISELEGTTPSAFALGSANVEEALFVVRNSSTQALYGFCATYYFSSVGIGVIGALFVDPTRRNLSIGHSLHTRAIRGLLQRRGIQRLQLGAGIPCIYQGVPAPETAERKHILRWFSTRGWQAATDTTVVTSMILRDLSSYAPSETLVHSLKQIALDFDLISGPEHADTVLEHVASNGSASALETYRLALADPQACGVVRAKSQRDGSVVGSVIVSRPGAQLASFVPALKAAGVATSGILAPVVKGEVEAPGTVVLGLVMLGMRQCQGHQAGTCVVDCVSSHFLLTSNLCFGRMA